MEKNSFFSPAEIDSSDINSEKPTIALSGVRISWLILAINVLLVGVFRYLFGCTKLTLGLY